MGSRVAEHHATFLRMHLMWLKNYKLSLMVDQVQRDSFTILLHPLSVSTMNNLTYFYIVYFKDRG